MFIYKALLFCELVPLIVQWINVLFGFRCNRYQIQSRDLFWHYLPINEKPQMTYSIFSNLNWWKLIFFNCIFSFRFCWSSRPLWPSLSIAWLHFLPSRLDSELRTWRSWNPWRSTWRLRWPHPSPPRSSALSWLWSSTFSMSGSPSGSPTLVSMNSPSAQTSKCFFFSYSWTLSHLTHNNRASADQDGLREQLDPEDVPLSVCQLLLLLFLHRLRQRESSWLSRRPCLSPGKIP